MRKFLSVLVVALMCVALLAPAAFAANTLDSLTAALDGVDISSLSDTELASLLGDLNLEGVDLDSLKESLSNGSSSALDGLQDKLGGITDGLSSSTDGAAPATDSALSNLSGMLGGIDMSWLSNVVSDPSAIISMFTSSDSASSGFDLSSLKDMISGAFSGSGIDLNSMLGNFDVGSFDISSLLGNIGIGGAASGASDVTAGIADALKSGLEKLGLDPSFLDGLMDNDIVNFFANLFMGIGDLVNPGSSDTPAAPAAPATPSDSEVPAAPSAPATPNTGDTSAVFVALGTISVAAAAAFVCLMKKE